MASIVRRLAPFFVAGSILVVGIAVALPIASGPDAPSSQASSHPPPPVNVYTGPVFSVHEHASGGSLTMPQTTDFYAAMMEQHNITRMVIFVAPSLEQQIKAAAQKFPGLFVPFYRVVDAQSFSVAPDTYRQKFSEGSFWAGSGEWGLYRDDLRPGGVPADDPILLQVYDVVAQFDRTVMVHPDTGDRPGVERALQHNRATPLYIHSSSINARLPCASPEQSVRCMDMKIITDLMDAHPNFYFDLSGTTNPHMQDTREDLLTHYRGDLDFHVDEAYRVLGPVLDAYPDRFLMGWDSGSEGLDFDPELFALGVEFYRKLLGRLTPATADKVAFRNAERVLLRIPTLESPALGTTLSSLGTSLSWLNPPNTTQYQIQVVPANNEGPGSNLIIGDPAMVASAKYQVLAPEMGVGNYVMLPGMSYSWRVRATPKATFAPENDPSWRPWSESYTFRTPVRDSSRITPVSPANGATLGSEPQVLRWANGDTDVFYYEIQVSSDLNFETDPSKATAAVWWNLVHGGVTNPLNSWTTPPLPLGSTYYWRVRPRVQGDGTPVPWSATWSFRTP